MPWIETYKTKRGKRRRVRDRVGGKKTSQNAGPYKDTAFDIRNQMEDESARRPLNLPDHKKTIGQVIEDFLVFCEKSGKKCPNCF